MMPPLFLNLRVGGLRLWLPIFIFIPLIYLAIGLFDLFLIPVLLCLVPRGRKLACAKVALIEPFRILNATKGLTVEVNDSVQKILISVS